MTIVHLEPVESNWLLGTREERQRASEILTRNWDTLRSHTLPAQTLEPPTPSTHRLEHGPSTEDIERPSSVS